MGLDAIDNNTVNSLPTEKFGDHPTDAQFVHGLVSPDRIPHPAMRIKISFTTVRVSC